MTTPAERTRAVIDTRALLLQLCARDDVPVDVHRQAERLLRHYPHGGHIDVASAAMPMVWGPGTDGVPTDVPTYPELLAKHHTVRLSEHDALTRDEHRAIASSEPAHGNVISSLLDNTDR